MSAPPPIPNRSRQHSRRKSLQGPSAHPSNRVHIQPASPEVISSLISSLSIISSPANELFESHSTPVSPATSTDYFSYANNNSRVVGGSFGIDYGAFKQPSLRELIEEESLDELAASPPIIRTAKPPSGFSPLTAPKSPAKDSSSLKNFLRSRPSSKGSLFSKDKDDSSIVIGNLSVEPGVAPPPELRKKRSTDSWDKKQGRAHRGLMYMSSKERLREKDQEKKWGGGFGGTNPKGLGLDRLQIPEFDVQPFMAETPITEEPFFINEQLLPLKFDTASTPPIPSTQYSPPPSNSPGGIGSGRFIPMRDSSLCKPAAQTKRRDSERASRQLEKEREHEKGIDSDHRGRSIEQQENMTSSRKSSHLKVPIEGPEPPSSSPSTTLPSRQISETAKLDEQLLVENGDNSTAAPTVTQRTERLSPSPDRNGRLSSQQTKLEGISSKPLELKIKRSNSRLKRLSAPLSPRLPENDSSSNNQSRPTSRVVSPEPSRLSEMHLEGRPSSADSIDDAVKVYLASPRLSQKIRHPQSGRTISFSEVGDPEGFAVFCCVGMGLTRYITAFYDELALTLKLRLITPDRPGVGENDVYSICQALRITKFSLLAHSAGAIYALATALRMPQHIRGRLHLLAPWIPPSQLTAFGTQNVSPPANSIPTAQRILRALPTPILRAANSSFMSATSSSITSRHSKQKKNKRKSSGRETPSGRRTVTPGLEKENQRIEFAKRPDSLGPGTMERALNDPNDPNNEAAILAAAASNLAEKERQMAYDNRLTHGIWDLAILGANSAVDLLVCLERKHTIGFRYVDITRATVIHHGSKDTRVPVENVRWLGKTMKRCEVRVLEGEGHGLMASAAVMGGVLMEIAREWEDWMQVTGSAGNKTGDGLRRTLRERASVGAFR